MKAVCRIGYFSFLTLSLLLLSCNDDPSPDDLSSIPYAPKNFVVQKPSYYPAVESPADNPLTEQGVNLGRHLFFDKILSGDQTMSCSSCHDPLKGFTDGLATSKGIDGMFGKRSSMSLLNLAFARKGLFWDGRAKDLEDQALRPIEDPIELHADLSQVVTRLQNHDTYPKMFREAFGITSKKQITKDHIAKALAQYERIIISGESKYDQWRNNLVSFTDEELLGYSMYVDVEGDGLPDAECHHCHQLDLATADDFFNNGLQSAPTMNDFADLGKGGFTNNITDNGKFRAPTLRNIMLTAPYMHNGSLNTIDDVLAHYNSGGKTSLNKDQLIHKLNLNPDQINALKAFLSTLTDTTYVKNPLFSSPF